MSEFLTEDSEKSTERGVVFMSAVSEASYLLRRAAEPRPVGDSIKQAITRAARRCGLAPSRVEDIWRGEARLVRAEEMDAIRRAAAKSPSAQEAEARDELIELRGRIARLEELLMASDQDFHRPSLAALRDQAGEAGGEMGAPGRPMDRK